MTALSTLTSLTTPINEWLESKESLQGQSFMDHLYNRLDGAYLQKWRSNFQNEQAIENWRVSWAEAFEAEGLKPRDIKAGLDACRSKYDWPPSCAEFIKACSPSENHVLRNGQWIDRKFLGVK